MRNYIDALWALNMGPMSRNVAMDSDSAVIVIVGVATILSALLAVI